MFGRFDPQLNELHNLDCGLREPDFHLNRSARHEWRRNTPDSSRQGQYRLFNQRLTLRTRHHPVAHVVAPVLLR